MGFIFDVTSIASSIVDVAYTNMADRGYHSEDGQRFEWNCHVRLGCEWKSCVFWFSCVNGEDTFNSLRCRRSMVIFGQRRSAIFVVV